MATVNLGSIKFKWKGTYAGGTAYTIDDVVSYNGSSYICIQASTGNLPTNATYFEQMSSKGTDADLLNIASTAQGDIYYNNGGAIARLAPGSANQVLQTGGTGANPSWGTVSSDMVKISSGTLGSGTANWSIDGHFSSTYYNYKIFINQLTTANNGATIFAKMNTGGSAYGSSDYSWSQAYFYSTSIGNVGNNSDNKFRLNQNSSNADFPSCNELTIFNPTNTGRRTQILMQCFGQDSTGGATNGTVGGVTLKINTAVTGITIFSDGGGNILTGAEYVVYGMK